MELIPSAPHDVAALTRVSGVREFGFSVVPVTPVQTANDCWMTCSISVSRPLAVWSRVNSVTGLVASDVLHRTAMLPGPVVWREGTGHAEPPESDPGNRTSGTVSLNAYPAAAAVLPKASAKAIIVFWKR